MRLEPGLHSSLAWEIWASPQEQCEPSVLGRNHVAPVSGPWQSGVSAGLHVILEAPRLKHLNPEPNLPLAGRMWQLLFLQKICLTALRVNVAADGGGERGKHRPCFLPRIRWGGCAVPYITPAPTPGTPLPRLCPLTPSTEFVWTFFCYKGIAFLNSVMSPPPPISLFHLQLIECPLKKLD